MATIGSFVKMTVVAMSAALNGDVPALLIARTRYRYDFADVALLSVYAGVGDVPICVNATPALCRSTA